MEEISDRMKKIKELQIKNKRKNVIKELSNNVMSISVDSFLSVEKTIELTQQLYLKIDTIPFQENISKKSEESVNRLMQLKESFEKLYSKDVVLLHYLDREIGAFFIKMGDFFENVDFILKFIKYTEGYRDLAVFDEKLFFGVCIERCEYYNNLVVWNNTCSVKI